MISINVCFSSVCYKNSNVYDRMDKRVCVNYDVFMYKKQTKKSRKKQRKFYRCSVM